MEQDNEKKERVIHMRVEPSLDSELKERAGRLGLSVSNLVRNILQHTFGLAGDVIKDSALVARSARGEPLSGAAESTYHTPKPTRDTGFGGVEAAPARTLGWQRFTLGLNALCERCNAILPKGTEAAIGVLEGPGRRPITCLPCVEEPTHAAP